MARPPTVDIDEFTLVLSLKDADIGTDWVLKSGEMVETFLVKSKLEIMFGKFIQAFHNLPKGYSSGLIPKDKAWYMAVAWHDEQPRMGVCIRFSAHAWAVYQAQHVILYGELINIASFLAMIESDVYNAHFSRIDLVADYFDFPHPTLQYKFISPHMIYTRILAGDYIILNHNGVKAVRSMSAIDKDGEYQTVYFGSKQGAFFLRLYDKRAEQFKTKGFRYSDAQMCRSWVRFEMVTRYEYSRQITEQLRKIHTQDELQALIAKHISDKFRFFDNNSGTYTEFTEELLLIASGSQTAPIKLTSPRNMELSRSIDYMKHSSGLYSLFYKVVSFWGIKGLNELLEILKYEFCLRYLESERNNCFKDAENWCKKHFDDYFMTELKEYCYLDTRLEVISSDILYGKDKSKGTATTDADHASTPDTTTGAT